MAKAKCSLCDRVAVTHVLVRIGELPDPYRPEGSRVKDLSRLAIVRLCDRHRTEVPSAR